MLHFSNLPLELVNQKDFIAHIAVLEKAMPGFFNNAPVAEIIDRYTGKTTVDEMNHAMETAR